MKLLVRLLTIFCLAAAVGHASDVLGEEAKSEESAQLVKGFVVTGALTKVIGTFHSRGVPNAGLLFEIDLGNLPQKKFTFVDPQRPFEKASFFIPFSATLAIESVRLQKGGTGRAVINLSAVDASGKFLIQVAAEKLEKGRKVKVWFSRDGGTEFMGSMAEAEGILK